MIRIKRITCLTFIHQSEFIGTHSNFVPFHMFENIIARIFHFAIYVEMKFQFETAGHKIISRSLRYASKKLARALLLLRYKAKNVPTDLLFMFKKLF